MHAKSFQFCGSESHLLLKKLIYLDYLIYLVELFICPILRKLADAALNSGLAGDGWLKHLIVEQWGWLAEINDVGHQASPALSISLVNQIRS